MFPDFEERCHALSESVKKEMKNKRNENKFTEVDAWTEFGNRLIEGIDSIKHLITNQTNEFERKRLMAKLDGMNVALSYYEEVDRMCDK